MVLWGWYCVWGGVLRFAAHARSMVAEMDREAVMSGELKKVVQRFEERLGLLESGDHVGPAHWKIFHLHNALNVLKDDHAAADLHLNEFDRAELARDFPELEADKIPTVEELRSRFDMIAGGML
jgi:hypothetical protein